MFKLNVSMMVRKRFAIQNMGDSSENKGRLFSTQKYGVNAVLRQGL